MNTLYGGLLRLYPRAFRNEYGEDMVLLLQHQLRDENAARVWGRLLLDLAITVPSLRLEAHMSARTSAPVVFGALTVGSLALAVIGGTAVGVSLVGAAGALLFGSLAVISWRRTQALGRSGTATASWWKYVLAGGAVLASCVALVNVGDHELPGNTWAVWMGALLTSFVLLGVGVVLGISHAASRRTA
ncbi:MAG: hypothetical protein M3P04_06390 [Actinomycetota bacterium]|nr:hypothetical protein [Actinomycetota bacterium]